jgi:hypothetical protein
MAPMNDLTLEQQATNAATLLHIMQVRDNLNRVIAELLKRGEQHDQTKLASPEVELFTELTPQLAAVTYGSPEYQAMLERLKPALEHHYAKARHHPEHWPNGIADMDLVDLVELFCDWVAASKRHHNGNIRRSVELNAVRFNINPQLVRILENTASLFE